MGKAERQSWVDYNLDPATEEELELTRISVGLAQEQLAFAQRQTELTDYLAENMPELFADIAGSGAIDEEGYEEALERLRSGGASDEQRRLISDVVTNALALGESDINQFMQSGIENIRDVLAPERGLRPGDSPMLGLGSGIVEEGQRQQGELVNYMRGYEADTLLNLPYQQNYNTLALQGQLQSEAFNNRLRLAGGVDPGVNVPQALSVVQHPRMISGKETRQASRMEELGLMARNWDMAASQVGSAAQMAFVGG